MYTQVLMPLLVAFFATAGAIPLCRSFIRKRSGLPLEPPVGAAPSVAGAGMIFGLSIAYYYYAPDHQYQGMLNLLSGVGVAVAAGSWLDLRGRKRLSGFELLLCELAISVVAVAVIVLPALIAGSVKLVGVIMLLGMSLCTPAAIAVLGRLPRPRPALPMAIAFSQVIVLALLSMFAAIRHPVLAAWYDGFQTIAFPLMGATAGALIYLSRMPWRSHEAIATGSPTRLALGVVVAWGAVCLGIGSETLSAPFPDLVWAIVWVLIVPLCELARLCCIALWRRFGGERYIPIEQNLGSAHPSAAMILALTLAAGSTGLMLYAFQSPAQWIAVLLAPVPIGYILLPLLLQSSRTVSSPKALDTHG